MTLLQQDAAAPPRNTIRSRIGFIDAVRVMLIVLVVAHHSVEAYVVRHPSEIPLPGPPIPRAWVFLWVDATFFMGLFFLLAGYFTADALDRKGASGFVGDRLRRLGLPLLFGTLAIVPITGWAQIALDPAMPAVSYWSHFTRDFLGIGPKPAFWPTGARWPEFNFGHLWFIEHLLLYALLYAGLRMIVAKDRGGRLRNPPSHGALVAYALLLTAATFIVRIRFPQDRWIGFLGFIQMEPAHVPQYLSLFVIGVVAGPRRWLETMPTRRGLIWLGIGGGLAAIVYLLVGTGIVPRGFNSRALWVCTLESFLCVGLCVGLPVLFRTLAIGTGRLWQAAAANVFAVYVFHFPIVLLLQWALIDAPAPKWVRMVVTVMGAVAASFAFTNWVVLRLPYARRVF